MTLRILSGGAANGLVEALRDAFRARAGVEIEGDFGAVGGMRDRVLEGEPMDLVILTRAAVEELAASGHVEASSMADLGAVRTGVAAREGSAPPDVSDEAALRRALLDADALYVPDTAKATAGLHVARTLAALGIADAMAGRLREFPNGQTAMAAMAAGDDRSPLGCTQVTEILNTEGVRYAGDLPDPHGLSTVYTAALAARAAEAGPARDLIALLTADEHASLRGEVGFS